MEHCRFSTALRGAFLHPLDQTPIDQCHSETIATERLPVKSMIPVDQPVVVGYGDLTNPTAVLVINVAGQGATQQPSEEEQQAHDAKVLQVGLTDNPDVLPNGWQRIPPAPLGKRHAGNLCLRPVPGHYVMLRPAIAGTLVPAKVTVIPGPD